MLFQVVRKSGKQFRQRRPDGNGGWVEGSGALNGVRRVLYNLPAVQGAVSAGGTVYIAEGEKDVDALVDAGVVATCNPGGALKWRDDYAEALVGASTVIVVQDRDDKGREHAQEVATSLRNHSIHVVVLEAKTGKDAYDHLAAGYSVEELLPVVVDRPLRPSTAPAPPTSSPRWRHVSVGGW